MSLSNRENNMYARCKYSLLVGWSVRIAYYAHRIGINIHIASYVE